MVYQWTDKEAMGWRIDEGPSRFLIAEGSGYSRSIGLALFLLLSRENRFNIPIDPKGSR